MIALSLSALFACAGGVAQADTIINAHVNDATLRDTDDDNAGNSVLTSGTTIAVGEWSNGADANEQRFWLPFELTAADRTAIAGASSITLDLSLTLLQNVDSFTVDLYGLADRTSSAAVAGDFEAAASPPLTNNAFTGASITGRHHFDVTGFVQTEAAKLNSVIVFRLQIDPDLPNTDSLINNFTFAAQNHGTESLRPTLTVTTAIPAPAALPAGLVMLGTLIMRRRR
jgi:hypothetical protein